MSDSDGAVLVLRDGRLTAVLSHLGAMHDEMAGMWFVEAQFGDAVSRSRYVFADPKEYLAWLDDEGL